MYIGLDLGTSAVKAVLFDLEGNMIKRSSKEYGIHGAGEDLEISPNELLNSVIYVLSEVAVFSKEIKAIGISSLGEACVLIDSNGNPLMNSILPGDKRGAEYLPDLLSRINETNVVEITGVPVNSTYTINKILWIKKKRPDIYEKTYKFMLFGNYIAYKLTGEEAIDYSLASRTMAFDYKEKKFSSVIAKAAEIEEGMFPKVVSPGTLIGKVSSAIARDTGLSPNTLVFAGSHDQPCAALGSGAIKKGEAIDSIGTSECITPIIGKSCFTPEFIKSTNFACEPFIEDGIYNTMAFTHTAGRLLNWYVNSIIKENDSSPYQKLDKLCSAHPTKLLILPHFSGSGTPYIDHASTGAIVGLNLHTNDVDLYQAMMESISYEMRINIDLLHQNGIQFNRIIAAGGGSNSDVWLNYKANIYNIPISTLQCNEASAMGAAMIAAKGDGNFDSFDEAIKMMVKVKKVYYPNPRLVPEFYEQYQKYQNLYSSVKNVYRKR